MIRSPESLKDPSALRVDWDEWSGMATEGYDAAPGQEAKVTEADVFNMSGDMLDRYLDWYHQTWSGERDGKGKISRHSSRIYLNRERASLIL